MLFYRVWKNNSVESIPGVHSCRERVKSSLLSNQLPWHHNLWLLKHLYKQLSLTAKMVRLMSLSLSLSSYSTYKIASLPQSILQQLPHCLCLSKQPWTSKEKEQALPILAKGLFALLLEPLSSSFFLAFLFIAFYFYDAHWCLLYCIGCIIFHQSFFSQTLFVHADAMGWSM